MDTSSVVLLLDPIAYHLPRLERAEDYTLKIQLNHGFVASLLISLPLLSLWNYQGILRSHCGNWFARWHEYATAGGRSLRDYRLCLLRLY
jgi:hypothetical protein